MTSTTTRQEKQTPLDENSWWTTSSLLSLSAIMLAIGSLWRIVDIFVLGLGDTWLNILPSKLFPLLILVLVFHRFRREELSTVLGLSQEGIISHT
ncbi:MAG: hypothetical protein JSW61_11310, partial [Candidatus Thorarchaeota archaeon]